MQTKIWIPLLSDGVGSMCSLNSPVTSVGRHSTAGALVFHGILLHLYFGKSQILICLGKLFGGNQQPYNQHTLSPRGSYGKRLSQLQNYLQFQILILAILQIQILARIWSCMRGWLSQLVITRGWGEIRWINLMGCKWLLQWGAEICECSDQQPPGPFCCLLLLRSSVGPQARGCSSLCPLPTWAHG